MANALYTTYKNRLEGSGSSSLTDWDADTIKAVLCSASYTPSINTDAFLSDIAGAARVATTTVTGISISFGAVISTLTATFSSVSGSVATQMVLYKDTGSASTSPLLVYYDTFATGMPVTPNGGNITLSFDPAAIFEL